MRPGVVRLAVFDAVDQLPGQLIKRDAQHLARGGQEDRGAGDLVRLADAAVGNPLRRLLAQAPGCMSEDAVLVLEIGNERPNFERAFPDLAVTWLPTSAGDDPLLLITRDALLLAD